MIATLKQTLNNENGFVLVVALLMLAIITVYGIAATHTSDTEMQIAANERSRTDDFYSAEGGLIDISERSASWLTDNFLTAGAASAGYVTNVDLDGNGVNDALVEVRYITDSAVTVSALSTPANDLPLGSHIGPPPAGSGYSLKYFEVRRYGVTSTAANGETLVQLGVWKLFNKY